METIREYIREKLGEEERRRLADACPMLEQSVKFARATGDTWLLALCLLNLDHSIRLRDYEASLPVAEESIRLARETGDSILLGEALFIAANAAYGYGDNQRAADLASELVEVSRRTGRKLYLALGLYLLDVARLFGAITPVLHSML